MPVSLFLSLCVHPHRNGSSWNSMNLRQRPKRDAIQRVKGSVWQPYWMRVKIVSKCYFILYSSCFTSFVDCAESTWALWNLWTNETGAHPVFMCLLARAHTHPLHIIHQSILFALRLLSNFVPKQNHFIFRLCKQCTDTHTHALFDRWNIWFVEHSELLRPGNLYSLLSKFCASMIAFVWIKFPTCIFTVHFPKRKKTKGRERQTATDKSRKKGGRKWDKLKISIVYSQAFGTIGKDMCKYFHGRNYIEGGLARWMCLKFHAIPRMVYNVHATCTPYNQFSRTTNEHRSTTWNCFQNRINSLIFYMALKSVPMSLHGFVCQICKVDFTCGLILTHSIGKIN